MAVVNSKLEQLKLTLTNTFVQREAEVTGVLAGLLTGEPTFLVGEPGTAKTALIETLARLIGGQYFYYLLTRFTEPDELLGGWDIAALRQGVYKRITKNKLPEAEIVFLDEIFKASSAVRNILLDIILNKRYNDGTGMKKLPMLALYTASNEISTDAEDRAFYDRLLIRCFVKPVSSDSWLDLLDVALDHVNNHTNLQPILSVEEVRAFQAQVKSTAVDVRQNKQWLERYVEVLSMLEERGIHLTDRRKVKTIIVAVAIGVLYAEPTPSLDSLADALRFTAPHDEDDLPKIEEIIHEAKLSAFADHVEKIMTLKAEIDNIMQDIQQSGMPDIESIKALNQVRARIVDELKRMPRSPRLLPYIKQLKQSYDRATKYVKKLLRELGVDE